MLIKSHRFSESPVAWRQIHELIERQDELDAAGIETIVVLHSSEDKVLPDFNQVPGLHIIAERQTTLYGADQSELPWRQLRSRASWRATFASFAQRCSPRFNRFEGGIVGVPSDFLVDAHGTVMTMHYGRHLGDR